MPENADNKAVTWASSDPEIASVNENGVVTALAEEGTATITVTTQDGGKTATCQVKVTPTANIAPCATHYITMVTQKPTTKKLELEINVANEADKAGVWIDLNNNGAKDTGEEVTNFASKQEYQFTSPIITLYGKVTYLVCSYNRLSRLDISHNTDLVTLKSFQNRINTIDLTKNIGLQSLVLFGAGLTELDLSQNTNLTWIVLGSNRLKELNLNAQKELTYLGISDNQFTTLDVSQNTKLNGIACYLNQIKGTSMDDLIDNVPTREATNKGELYVKIETRGEEQNEITATQIAAAKAKNWRVFIWTEEANDWVEQ